VPPRNCQASTDFQRYNGIYERGLMRERFRPGLGALGDQVLLDLATHVLVRKAMTSLDAYAVNLVARLGLGTWVPPLITNRPIAPAAGGAQRP
jgi:hypothetical protein